MLNKNLLMVAALAAVSSLSISHGLRAAEPGFESLFNGRDLTGWEGNPKLWSVRDGAITGVTGSEGDTKISHNTFLVWTNGTVGDFELRLSYRIEKGNSGIQYRSKLLKQGPFGPVVGGYQADFEAGKTYSGILYEEQGRGILAQRGEKTVIREVEEEKEGKKQKKMKVQKVGTVGESAAIQAKIKHEDWNDYVVIAKGNHLQHFINGQQTVDVVDEHEAKAAKSGILALQIHAGPAMVVQFKDVRIKKLSGGTAKTDLQQLEGVWVPTEMVVNGKPVDAEEIKAITVTIKGNSYKTEFSNGQDEGTFKLLEGAGSKRMDLASDSGQTILAIYEVSGDTLRSCYAVSDTSRPTEFKSVEDSNHVLAVYKRKVN
jgi:uncharacterized protein (TIGR03067 family)